MQDNRSEMRRGAFMTVMVMAFSPGKLINIKFRRWNEHKLQAALKLD